MAADPMTPQPCIAKRNRVSLDGFLCCGVPALVQPMVERKLSHRLRSLCRHHQTGKR
jgi:hypothetical protein